MSRRRRWLRILLVAMVLIAAIVIYAAWPGSSTYTISPETTYVTGPLEKDGHIDYVTALNERLRGDITPETNANVLIWQALGPWPDTQWDMPSEYFQWLGIDAPPATGDYFVWWGSHVTEQVKFASNEELTAYLNVTDRYRIQPWSKTEIWQLAAWLQRNSKPLGIIVAATHRPHYFNPLVPPRTEGWSAGLTKARLPAIQRCRAVVDALLCRSMGRLADGNVEEAWSDLVAAHRLAGHLGQGATSVECLVSYSIESIVNESIIAFAESAPIDSNRIAVMRRELQQMRPVANIANVLDTFERFMTLDALMQVVRTRGANLDRGGLDDEPPKKGDEGSPLITRSVNWDPAFRNVNRWYDRYLQAIRIPDRKQRKLELARFLEDLLSLKGSYTDLSARQRLFMQPSQRGELIGNMVIRLLIPAAGPTHHGFSSIPSAWRISSRKSQFREAT